MAKNNVSSLVLLCAVVGAQFSDASILGKITEKIQGITETADKYGTVTINDPSIPDIFMDDNNLAYQFTLSSSVISGNKKVFWFGDENNLGNKFYEEDISTTVVSDDATVYFRDGYPKTNGRVAQIKCARITVEADNDSANVNFFKFSNESRLKALRRDTWRTVVTGKDIKDISITIELFE